MAIQTTYTHARAHLAALCDEVTANREVVIIHRRGAEDVALIAADELSGLLETAHLLRSPTNAERLLTALAHAQSRTLSPQSLDDLRRESRPWQPRVGGLALVSAMQSFTRSSAKTCATGSRQSVERLCACWLWWKQCCATPSEVLANRNR